MHAPLFLCYTLQIKESSETVNNSIIPVQMSFNRLGQGKMDRYLISKNIKIEGSGQKSVLESAAKLKTTDNINRSPAKSTHNELKQQRIADYQPSSGEAQILKVISIKKSAKKEYKDTDTDQLHTSNQQLSRSQSLSLENRMVFPQLILIGPFDLVDSEILERKLEYLMTQCNKKTIIEWIKNRHERNEGVIRGYQLIESYEDEQFWCYYTQQMIGMLLKEQRQFNSCIKLLPKLFQNQEVVLTRKKIFLLIASMFFSIIPHQCNTNLVSLIELMVLKSPDEKSKEKSAIRFQKLKCVINYLKCMVDNPQIYNESITIIRAYSTDQISRRELETPLSKVIIQDGKIQQGYGKGIVIDFANENVGGGFLTNGSAQEEILFSIFPEMIVTKLLCDPLNENQAIIVRGARRFNNYEGYLASFKYLGSYYSQGQRPESSCIVAIDALDFSKIVTGKQSQYSKKFIRREMHKAHLGIQGGFLPLVQSNQRPEVYTGKWGCGVFKADETLKFLIQWMACSEVGVDMRFNTCTEKVLQMRLLYENLKDQTTSSLLQLVQSYSESRRLSEKGFLGYLKYHS